MRLKLIACEILFREICAAVARSPHRIDVQFMPKGLHDIGQKRMSAALGEMVDRNEFDGVDRSQYDAILLGYALCSNGITGLTASDIPLIVPKAHDCITLFLGDRQRYLDYFHANPGTYFKTSGWIERGDDLLQFGPDSMQEQMGLNQSYEEMVEKYGPENAKYLWQQLGEMQNYGKLAFIDMGIGPSDRFERETQQMAKERDWEYERIEGDMSLLQALADGPWDDDDRFLVVQPGQSIAQSFDDDVIQVSLPK